MERTWKRSSESVMIYCLNQNTHKICFFGQQQCTRALKIHIFASPHICPWHLRVSLLESSFVVIEWKIVFLWWYFVHGNCAKAFHYYCCCCCCDCVCQPSSELARHTLNGPKHSKCASMHIKCTHDLFRFLSSKAVLFSSVRPLARSRAHTHTTTLTIQERNIKWQTFIYGPS